MFKIKDRVWLKDREVPGTVVFEEDGYIEIQLDNGTEVSFESLTGLEAFNGQVATPKRREPNWSELFQARLDDPES